MYLFSFIVQILINYVILHRFLALIIESFDNILMSPAKNLVWKDHHLQVLVRLRALVVHSLVVSATFEEQWAQRKQDGRPGDDVKAKVVKRSLLWSRTPVRSPLVDFYPHMNQASLAGPHFYIHRPVAFSKLFSHFASGGSVYFQGSCYHSPQKHRSKFLGAVS